MKKKQYSKNQVITIEILDDRLNQWSKKFVTTEHFDAAFHTTNKKFEAIDKKFDAIDQRFEAIDRKFDAIDQRFEAIDRKFDAIDQRFEAIDRKFDAIDQRFEAIDKKFDAIDQRLDHLEEQFVKMFITLEKILTIVQNQEWITVKHVISEHENQLFNHEKRIQKIEGNFKYS